MDKQEFYRLLQSVPKAEIHLHAEAIIGKNSIKTLYKKNLGKDMSDQEISNIFTYGNLSEFIESFLEIQRLFKSPEDFNLLFDDIIVYLEENHIVYCELFLAPSTFIRNGLSYSEILAVFTARIDALYREKKIVIKLLIDISRTFGYDNAFNNYVLVKQNPSPHIIGIGLGGDEKRGAARLFADLFQQAKKEGFHVVAHAGEDAGPESIWDAINYLNIERIGHGIAAIADPELIEYLKEKQIPLEICITSNVFTKKIVSAIKDHPIKELFARGVFVTLNTDDPTFFNISLLDEYWNLHHELNFGLDDVKRVLVNGFEASFLPPAEKRAYIKKLTEAWETALAAVTR